MNVGSAKCCKANARQGGKEKSSTSCQATVNTSPSGDHIPLHPTIINPISDPNASSSCSNPPPDDGDGLSVGVLVVDVVVGLPAVVVVEDSPILFVLVGPDIVVPVPSENTQDPYITPLSSDAK